MKITAICGGCNATADAGRVVQRFHSISGRGLGVGRYCIEIDWTLPDDWVPFDLIGCTYCPECAKEIWPPSQVVLAREQSE